MKTIAQRGRTLFLVALEDRGETGRVYDATTGVIGPPTFVESIVATGYWDDVTDQAAAAAALAAAGDPPPA